MQPPVGVPFVVAHRAGNDLDRLKDAIALGVGFVEADVRLYRGRDEVRHLKTLGPLPVLWDRWLLANPFAPRLRLAELLAAVDGRATLVLDLKGRDRRLAGLVLDALAGFEGQVFVCARSWSLLEAFVGRPRVSTVASVGTRRQLRRLLRLETIADAVSIHARLLDRAVVAELRERVRLVLSWPVNTPADGRRLSGWGVDGLISDAPAMLVPVKAPGES